ncbi:MAG TPA: sigma-70 family RNA polymerase sigma factor [Streptosporangiaceae bacterium]|nr:sigma-70 family RNA polymerase sigma factor [Streptosporangiaceae bacterium]
MKPDPLDSAAALSLPGLLPPVRELNGTAMEADEPAVAVGALYQATATGLIRLAYVILGDRQAAEDVVQDAFCNLFRSWDRLSHLESAEYYLRVAVLNACRSALRRRAVRARRVLYELPAPSVEAAVLGGEERDELIRAVDRLPRRQRETLILSYYLDLPDDEIATLMGVRTSSVRSARHRALETLARHLKERS